MAREDDETTRPPDGWAVPGAAAALVVTLGADLGALSAHELESRAAALEAEAGRMREAAATKRAHAAAAGAVFRF